MKNIFLILLFNSLLIASCGTKTKEPSSPDKRITASSEASDSEHFSPILATYLALKDALVESDAALARSKSVRLVSALEQNSIKGEIVNHADAIAGSEDIEYQRAEFEKISKEIYHMAKKSKLGPAVVYKQFCPMAFDNKGAYWLSSSEKIMNPYFGNKMLHCGKVEETIISD